MNFTLEISKKGIPCLWESGGGSSNTGNATIIAADNGQPIPPIYVKTRGDLSNEKHALIPVHPGAIVIIADHHRGDFEISVYRLGKNYEKKIIPGLPARSAGGFGTNPATPDREEFFWPAEKIAQFSQGEWDVDDWDVWEPAMEAAKEKATCYHCREPHYIAT